MSHVPIYLSVMHIKLSLHTLAAIILCGLISDLLPCFKLLWGLTYPQLWFMAIHVSEVCGAYIYIEYINASADMRNSLTLTLLCFCFSVAPHAHLRTFPFAFLCVFSDKLIMIFAFTRLCKTPTGAVYLTHVCHFSLPQLQIYVLTWLHSLKQAGVFACCSQLQEYADRVWNSREACLKSQFTTMGSKTVKGSWILQFIFVICCFYDSSSILNCLFVSILKKSILRENRFELKKQKYI